MGKCKFGETLDSCSASHNYYNKPESCEASKIYDGKHIGITISCSGHTAGSEIQSCSGKKHNN